MGINNNVAMALEALGGPSGAIGLVRSRGRVELSFNNVIRCVFGVVLGSVSALILFSLERGSYLVVPVALVLWLSLGLVGMAVRVIVCGAPRVVMIIGKLGIFWQGREIDWCDLRRVPGQPVGLVRLEVLGSSCGEDVLLDCSATDVDALSLSDCIDCRIADASGGSD